MRASARFSTHAPRRTILVVGAGLAGLSCACEAASRGVRVLLAAPLAPERSQSVMAQGGINAALGPGDSPMLHAADTLAGGCFIEDDVAIDSLCEDAPQTIAWLERMGVLFTRNADGSLAQRPLGGQSRDRTVFSGAATGKQIISGLAFECRRHEAAGRVKTLYNRVFYQALISDERCFGALLANTLTNELEVVRADAVVMATGGLNGIFGRTTGTALTTGYATARLFEQGVLMRNLEFVQYHPTTVQTPQKRLLVSEAARGVGGRLYYLDDAGERVYFMEDRFGPQGNLMPRDVVSRCIYEAPGQVYLDVSFLGPEVIGRQLGEVRTLCLEYAGIDICKESIPVVPSVHFFMGGLWIDGLHKTAVQGLYAAGECASKYHGANRLGGNSLLAAVYGGRIAAIGVEAAVLEPVGAAAEKAVEQQVGLARSAWAERPSTGADDARLCSLRQRLEAVMDTRLGIARNEEQLTEGVRELAALTEEAAALRFSRHVRERAFELPAQLLLAEGVVRSALERRETRGAHVRTDYPERRDEFCAPSLCRFVDGRVEVSIPREGGVW